MRAKKAKTLRALVLFLNKFNRGLGCGFFVSLFLLSGCIETSKLAVPETKPSEIAGLQIGMSEDELIERIGKPSKIENVFPGGDYHILSYPGLTIEMSASGMRLDSPKVVTGIQSYSSDYCFSQDICPSDTLKSIMAKMSETEIHLAQNDKPALLNYMLSDLETCWLEVWTENLKTSTHIYIACQP